MTKDVLVSISGRQTEIVMEDAQGNMQKNARGNAQENEPLEVVTPGSYFLKNGKHYILYDEVVEGIPGVIKNKIKINRDDSLEVIKTGITNAHMVFEKNKKNFTYYQTPYGQMLINVNTRNMVIEIAGEKIAAQVDYELEVNEKPFADCTIKMKIVPKESAAFMLR